MQWGMLKKHYDRNIGPLYHAFILQLPIIELVLKMVCP
jgi:hypothetical protein